MRRVPRIPVEMDAELISHGANLHGTIINIGLQGRSWLYLPDQSGSSKSFVFPQPPFNL
jgi:hypothetical protein